MLQDALEGGSPPTHAQVVVIGSGPAGLAATDYLVRRGHKVLVLEAGPAGPNWTPDVYAGLNRGHDYSLTGTRSRVLGGTSVDWNGWSRPLERIVFDRREWMGRSDWPISFAQLEPWYREAHTFLRLGPYHYSTSDVAKSMGFPIPETLSVNSRIDLPLWRFVPQESRNLAESKRTLLENTNVEVLVNAPVLGIRARGNRVTHVEVAQPERGNPWVISVEHLILAGGGLETVRLLLVWRDRLTSSGLQLDQSGTLGQFWMEHPHVFPFGHLAVPKSTLDSDLHLFRSRREFQGVDLVAGFSPSARVQRQLGLPNMAFTIDDSTPHSSTSVAQQADPAGLPLVQEAMQAAASLGTGGAVLRQVGLRAESRPWIKSRIALSKHRDEFGLPRIGLFWRMRKRDLSDYVRGFDVFAREIARAGIGIAHQDPRQMSKPQLLFPRISGGHHHMGGARMSRKRTDGVIDSAGRLHSLPNLRVASSAIFPSGDFANPTLTIVALAQMMASAVADELEGSGG